MLTSERPIRSLADNAALTSLVNARWSSLFAAGAPPCCIYPILESLLGPGRPLGENEGLHNLTPRERECLRLVGRGLSTHAIAFEIGKSWHTVDAHIRSARGKLAGVTRAQAAEILAIAEGDTNLASKRSVIARTGQSADDGVSVLPGQINDELRDSAGHRFQVPIDWTGETGNRATDAGDATAIPVHLLAWTAIKTTLAVLALVVLALTVYNSMHALIQSLALHDMPPGANEGTVHAQPKTDRRATRP